MRAVKREISYFFLNHSSLEKKGIFDFVGDHLVTSCHPSLDKEGSSAQKAGAV
jgi:hypothetical protein